MCIFICQLFGDTGGPSTPRHWDVLHVRIYYILIFGDRAGPSTPRHWDVLHVYKPIFGDRGGPITPRHWDVLHVRIYIISPFLGIEVNPVLLDTEMYYMYMYVYIYIYNKPIFGDRGELSTPSHAILEFLLSVA